MNPIDIKLTLKSNNKKILNTQKLILLELFTITQTCYTLKANQINKKKISLLKSPHIHKYTWRTYLFKTYNLTFTFFTYKISFLRKLNLILRILNKNSQIKLNYSQ